MLDVQLYLKELLHPVLLNTTRSPLYPGLKKPHGGAWLFLSMKWTRGGIGCYTWLYCPCLEGVPGTFQSCNNGEDFSSCGCRQMLIMGRGGLTCAMEGTGLLHTISSSPSYICLHSETGLLSKGWLGLYHLSDQPCPLTVGLADWTPPPSPAIRKI